MNRIVIRRPLDVEGPVCRMLLPESTRGDLKHEILIAAQDEKPPIVGAIAWVSSPGRFANLRLRVIRTHRGQGIGRALWDAVLAEAQEAKCRQIYSRVDPEADAEGVRFLTSRGFQLATQLTTVEGDIVHMLEESQRLQDRLHSTGRVPADIRLIPLSEAPMDQIAALQAEHIVHNPEVQPLLAAVNKRSQKMAHSPVLMQGEKVAGFLLWTLSSEATAHVHARVVAPEFRGSWANTLLLHAGISDAWEKGARRTRFEIPGGNRDTGKLAKRFHADQIQVMNQYRLDI